MVVGRLGVAVGLPCPGVVACKEGVKRAGVKELTRPALECVRVIFHKVSLAWLLLVNTAHLCMYF